MKLVLASLGGLVLGAVIGVVLSGLIGMLAGGLRTSGIGLAAGTLPYLGAITGAVVTPMLVNRRKA